MAEEEEVVYDDEEEEKEEEKEEEEEEKNIPPPSPHPPSPPSSEDDFFSAPPLPLVIPPLLASFRSYCDKIEGIAAGTIPYLIFYNAENCIYSSGDNGDHTTLMSSPWFFLLLTYALKHASGPLINRESAHNLFQKAAIGGELMHKKCTKSVGAATRTIVAQLERILNTPPPVIDIAFAVFQGPNGALHPIKIGNGGYTPNIDFMYALCSAISPVPPFFQRQVFLDALDSDTLDLERTRWPNQDEVPKNIFK
jgi:hypothetical protein